MSAEGIYRRLPAWGQTLLIQAKGISNALRRRKSTCPRFLAELAAREQFTPSQLHDFRIARLTAHLQAAAKTPYWSDMFDRLGLNPRGLDPFAELAKLPVLSKSEVQAAGDALVNPSIDPRLLRRSSTSGTTGSGLRLWETSEAENERWGIWWRYRGRLGITPSTHCAFFGARAVVPIEVTKPPFWRINLPARQVMFSAFHLGPATLRAYINALEKQAAPWIHGFPTTLSMLAELMLDAGIRMRHKVEIITIGAENLQPAQRERISAAFGCRVAQHYGLAESVANISECKNGFLHVDEDFSHVELLPTSIDSNIFKIIGTNWSNSAFPLLRYDTGDLATPADETCPCGLAWRVIQTIDGRQDDMVVLRSGARVGRLAMLFKDFPDIREAQIRQSRPGEFTFLIVPGARYHSSGTEAKLLALAYERLGRESVINIKHVPLIERTRTGKLRLVVQEAPSAY